MIIGLTGYKQSGKDTTADILVRDFGFTKMAFGDALRQMAYAINPLIKVNNYHVYARYVDLLEDEGYEAAKQIPDLRSFLQKLGTEAVRNVLGDQVWIEALHHKAQTCTTDIVITDCRFLNEACYVEDEGGFIWRIKRGEQVTTDMHPSELGVDDIVPDFLLPNNGTIDELAANVHRLMEMIKLGA